MYKSAIWIIILTVLSFAGNYLNVIYPGEGQQIAAVDSTFILGNTHPQADLYINGLSVNIHMDGGFLAFLPVTGGDFAFNLVSYYGDDTCATSVNILVGGLPDTLNRLIDRSTISPPGRTVLAGDDKLEFSLRGKAGGCAFCSFREDTAWTQMYPVVKPWQQASVFGESGSTFDSSLFMTYTGYLSMNDMHDSSFVYYMFEKKVYDDDGNYLWKDFEIDSTGYYVVRLNELPQRVLKLIGRPHIIRTAPGKGYKLVNQPEGVRLLYAGETPDYYRVKLSSNVSGYVKKSEAVLEPLGTSLPEGEVAFVVANNFSDFVQISMRIGDQLPYEIQTDGDLMTIDIYGLLSDTDWIRFNDTGDYLKSIRWSQPQDDIYRLHVRWHDCHFWGYYAFYRGDEFVLRLKKKPGRGGIFRSPVHGLKIVIDPGHSHDSGAVGPTGLAEKDANLWIAHELRKILLDKGAEVLMTRMGHEHLGLYDRVDKAVKWEADLLISVHNNALPDGINPFTHNGASVYYYFDQAQPLAAAIHKHLLKETKLPDHGLYYGNLALCRVTECPAVLVECAFMMIPEQEAMLKTDKFQRKCAKAIYKGICDYLKDK
jgi:N-acetylmuramoyl-L-alanine amidase